MTSKSAARGDLEALALGRSLPVEAIEAAVGAVLDGDVAEPLIASFLTTVHVRGETADLIEGAVRAIRARMVRWDCGLPADRLIDTCGTGGDGARTVNISTAAAIVVAACGAPVVKHGNRAASGNSGSSDVLGMLGVAIDPGPEALARCLRRWNIAFLFAPRFHPGLKTVAAVRRQLPFRTLFNLVGPLCNPASPANQLVGVPCPKQAGLVAEVLARLGHVRRAVVVVGADGLDEVALGGPTLALVVDAGTVRRELWRPEDFGLPVRGAEGLRVDGPEDSAARIRATFDGAPGPVRDHVLANSSAALWALGGGPLREGVERAAHAIDSGAAAALLAQWSQSSQSSSVPS